MNRKSLNYPWYNKFDHTHENRQRFQGENNSFTRSGTKNIGHYQKHDDKHKIKI